MADLRKLIASMDSLNESITPISKPIVEGSMIKSLAMLSKADSPKNKLAEEFKQFKESTVTESGPIHCDVSANELHSEIVSVMKELADEYQSHAPGGRHVGAGAAPDSSKFRSIQYGMIEYAPNTQVHGGYYGTPTVYRDFLKMGSKVPSQVRAKIQAEFIHELGGMVGTTVAVGSTIITADGYTFLFNETGGTAWSGFGVQIRAPKTESTMGETIVKTGGGYEVKSEKGKNLGSGYKTKAAAQKRLGQVEYFKHQNEGIASTIAGKVMGAAPEKPKYNVGDYVKYRTDMHQPDWKDGGRGEGVITKYSNGHYLVNGNPVNHFDIIAHKAGATPEHPHNVTRAPTSHYAQRDESAESGPDSEGLGEGPNLDEARGDTIEAHGIRGMDRKPWQRTFKDAAALEAWLEKYDAECYGTRDVESYKRGNLSPAITELAPAAKCNAKVVGPDGKYTCYPTYDAARQAISRLYQQGLSQGYKVVNLGEEQVNELSPATVQSYYDKTAGPGLTKRVDSITKPGNAKGMRKIEKVPKVPGIFGNKTNRNAPSIAKHAEIDRIAGGLKRAQARGAGPWPELKGVPRDSTVAKKNSVYRHPGVSESDMPNFGYDPEEEKKDSKFFKQAFAAPKFGIFQRGGSIGGKKAEPVVVKDNKEEALAICKRYNNLLSPGEKQHYGIKYVVRNVQPEQVEEAMPPAVATAAAKMNPAANAAPTPATGAPNSPANNAPKTPGAQQPGAVGQPDPAVAKAQQAAYQKNINKLQAPGVNAAQAGVSMQKQADDMQMTPTDNANNAKIAGTLAGVLQDPQGAQQLKTLTDKFGKKPGQP